MLADFLAETLSFCAVVFCKVHNSAEEKTRTNITHILLLIVNTTNTIVMALVVKFFTTHLRMLETDMTTLCKRVIASMCAIAGIPLPSSEI